MEDRNKMKPKALIKDFLGEMPFTVEAYWLLNHRDKKIHSRFNLEALAARLPEMVDQVKTLAQSAPGGKKIFIFASMHSWINHITVTGLTLRGLGHDVTLGYLPYSDYDKPISQFDLRRHDLYAHHVLEKAQPVLKTVSFLDLKPAREIPAALTRSLEQVTIVDTQYTLQREDVTGNEPIYHLRAKRNQDAAGVALAYFEKNRPDVVIVPNGMIQEYGAVYETARFLGIQTVTYEFGEHNQRIWLGQDNLVVHHILNELWDAHKARKLDYKQRKQLESYFAERQGRTMGGDFAHLWQKAFPEGGAKVRTALGLDERPVILLPTNVLGDTATLELTVFSKSMTEWLQHVIRFLADRPEVQVVLRMHPAEALTVGPSVAEIIHQILPELPEHIHLIGSKEMVNTYDLMEIASLALVYTTTVGLEIATRGLPVLISGRAHYRKKGFTLDADSWEEYFSKLDSALKDLPACRLTPAQVEQAWNYAYCFFKEYPRPFPWHLKKIWKDLDKTPLAYVMSPKGRAEYEDTFQQLAGAVINWDG
jgi:hypothetical protein